MSDAIEGHRTAYERYAASLDAQDAAYDAYEHLPPDTTVEGIYRRHYEHRRGRAQIIANVEDEHRRVVGSVRASLAAIGFNERRIDAAVASADAKLETAVARVHAFFDAEDARMVASPLGAADRANDEANDAENAAWDALLSFPCATRADVQAKASYLASCGRTRGVSMQPADASALLWSLTGEGAADV